jgi:hypothetical protein
MYVNDTICESFIRVIYATCWVRDVRMDGAFLEWIQQKTFSTTSRSKSRKCGRPGICDLYSTCKMASLTHEKSTLLAPRPPYDASVLRRPVASELEQRVRWVTLEEAVADGLFFASTKGQAGTRDDPGGSWAHAADGESVDSFLARVPPSRSHGLSWISTHHTGRCELVGEYYASAASGTIPRKDRDGRMEDIQDAWNRMPDKSLDALSGVLQEHQYGSGKWMIFRPLSEIDAVWQCIVKHFWSGALGPRIKCSGPKEKSHVICVYVDPFFDIEEVTRVLRALREKCGIHEELKFKADGVTLLDIYRDNEWNIPPSFYSSPKGSTQVIELAGGSQKRRARAGAGRGGGGNVFGGGSKQVAEILSCRDCGNEFPFSKKEQDSYNGKGWSKPFRCKKCRGKRKSRGSLRT